MVVGLTGQTGSGKSTVSEVFCKAGFAVIDADRVARFVQRKGSPCLAEMVDYYGERILSEDGSLDRPALADIVFRNKSQLEALNAIVYPYITGEVLKQIRKHARMNKKIVLLDAPQLFESRTDDFCELIISVVAEKELRKKRIMIRDGINEAQAENRINSQHSQDFFMENSDYILKNNSSLEMLKEVAREVSDKIWKYYNDKYVC
jgi:dephospho-CoA kinase